MQACLSLLKILKSQSTDGILRNGVFSFSTDDLNFEVLKLSFIERNVLKRIMFDLKLSNMSIKSEFVHSKTISHQAVTRYPCHWSLGYFVFTCVFSNCRILRM